MHRLHFIRRFAISIAFGFIIIVSVFMVTGTILNGEDDKEVPELRMRQIEDLGSPLEVMAERYMNEIDHQPIAEETMIKVGTDGRVSENSTEIVEKQLLVLPEDLRILFNESGWKISVTDADLNQESFEGKYASVSGITRYSTKEILISDDKESLIKAPLHEIGHWIDNMSGYASQAPEFVSAMQELKRSYDREEYGYYPGDTKEYFADAVAFYFYSPDWLQETNPKIYSYIEDAVSGIIAG